MNKYIAYIILFSFCFFACNQTESTYHLKNIQTNLYSLDSIVGERIIGSSFDTTKCKSLLIELKLNSIPVNKGISIMAPILGLDGSLDSILLFSVYDKFRHNINSFLKTDLRYKSFYFKGYKKGKYQNISRPFESNALPIIPLRNCSEIKKLYNSSRRFKINDTLMINNSFIFFIESKIYDSIKPIKFELLGIVKSNKRKFKIVSKIDQ